MYNPSRPSHRATLNGDRGVLTTVTAPSRLHFGLFNESGWNGKVDGGAGIALSDPSCTVTVWDPSDSHVSPRECLCGGYRCEFERVVSSFSDKFGVPVPKVCLTSAIPPHVGLGSKTATLMALARALCNHYDIPMDATDMARFVGRGGTSGVGIHVSEVGGLIVDDGHRFPEDKDTFVPSSVSVALPPRLRLRCDPQPRWRVVIVELGYQGLSGKAEADFFNRNCPIPLDETVAIADVVDREFLPAITAGNLARLNAALEALQSIGLKRREWEIQHKHVRELRLAWKALSRHNPQLPPICLSSMGSTMYLISDHTEPVLHGLERLGVAGPGVKVVSPNASGSSVDRASR